MNRLYISKLIVRGEGLRDAILVFEKGFNTVTGASETGKSFAFSSINYALGSSKIPDLPPEAYGYSQVFLELIDVNDNVYTLNRSLLQSESNSVRLYSSKIDDINPSEFERLLINSRSKNSLSKKLNEIIECKYENVKSSFSGNTQSFTFRQYAHMLLIDENKIYAPYSPILSSDSPSDVGNPPAEFSFYTVLRGQDYPKQQNRTEQEKSKAKLKGMIDQLYDLCNNLRLQIEQNREKLRDLHLEEIQREIDRLNNIVNYQKSAIENSQNLLETQIIKLNKLEQEQLRIKQTLSRLILLKSNYESDIERLDFVEEAHDLTDQMVEIKCPLCHTVTTKQTYVNKDTFYKSLAKEKEKLRKQLFDLADTIDSFIEEHQTNEKAIAESTKQKDDLEEVIKKFVKDNLTKAISDIEVFYSLRDEFVKDKEKRDRLYEYETRIRKLEEDLLQFKVTAKAPSTDTLPESIINDFCTLLAQHLKNWNFSETPVSFDNKETDVIIGIKKKRVHGQGARAIINSSFIFAILEYCYYRGLTHPGFVILDSPLTTYKNKDIRPDDKKEDVSKDVKDAFYFDLSKTKKDVQIIVFDNYEPPITDVEINKHHFTGRYDYGRQGFIPQNTL